MGFAQRVTKKDSKGRITSSWVRVRKVVPPRLVASLPPPYRGKRTLTKKVSSEREHAEWTAKFLAMIDQAAERNGLRKGHMEVSGPVTPMILLTVSESLPCKPTGAVTRSALGPNTAMSLYLDLIDFPHALGQGNELAP
jgi:hypothetical protein